MKNLFSSPSNLPDFQNFSLKLEHIQKELREQRFENKLILKELTTCKKGIAILVSTPEPDLETEMGVDGT